MGNSGSNNNDLERRKQICRENAGNANHYANMANDRANDAQNHVNWVKSQSEVFPNDANSIATNISKVAGEAESLASQIGPKIKKISDDITTGATEERVALNDLVTKAQPAINAVIAKAKLVRDVAIQARRDADSSRTALNTPNYNGQLFANQARTEANTARTRSNEVTRTRDSGDGGDNQHSTNIYNQTIEHHNRTVNNLNTVRTIRINTYARDAFNRVNSSVKTANERLQQTKDFINTSQPLKDAVKKIIDYGNDHNFDFLYKEIAKIKPLLEAVEKKKPDEAAELKVHTDNETKYNADLIDYIDQLKKEKAKGTLFDQTDAEMKKLEADLKICTDKIYAHNKDLGIINGRIAISAAKLVTEQDSLTTNTNLKKTKFDEMNKAEKLYNDLSGELIQLQKDKASLESLITSEEIKYIELKEHINVLNKQIDELKIKDYSTKVYNNENLLELNKTIDDDLKKTFSYLKEENINPDLLNSKTKYRQIEKEKLSNTDKLLDILFYCFYFAFIIIRIVTRNTKTEDFLMYILIGLIPFVYPFMYKNSNYLIKLFNLDMNKNAFIEPETNSIPEISIDAYNI